MREVARAAGVSATAVLLVATGRPGVGEETRARILAAMGRLGYVHRSRSRRDAARYTVSIITARLVQPVACESGYVEVLQGIQTEAQRQRLRLTLHLLEGGESGVNRLFESLPGEVDGLILAHGGEVSDGALRRLVASRGGGNDSCSLCWGQTHVAQRRRLCDARK